MTTPVSRRAIVLYAEDRPVAGVSGPAPNQRYRHPRLQCEERALGPLDPTHLRVEMLYAGICGTDLHLVQQHPESGYVRTSAPGSIPAAGRVIGHEGVGRVLQAGTAVQGLQAGDLVAFASIHACLQCPTCRKGMPNQCPQAQLLGMEMDGLFAGTADVPASLAHDVSSIAIDDAGLRAAACLEPAGCALLACENAGIASGERVVVFGAGPIGLFAAIAARQVHGAAHVTLVEPLASRRSLAMPWCDQVLSPAELEAQLDGRVDVVLECSASMQVVNRIFRHVAPGGRIVLLGRSGESLVVDAVDHMITNAIRVSGSRGHLGGALPGVIALHRDGRLPMAAVVTGVLDSIDELLLSLQEPDRLPQAHCKLLARLN